MGGADELVCFGLGGGQDLGLGPLDRGPHFLGLCTCGGAQFLYLGGCLVTSGGCALFCCRCGLGRLAFGFLEKQGDLAVGCFARFLDMAFGPRHVGRSLCLHLFDLVADLAGMIHPRFGLFEDSPSPIPGLGHGARGPFSSFADGVVGRPLRRPQCGGGLAFDRDVSVCCL